jgi:hypothetical protein
MACLMRMLTVIATNNMLFDPETNKLTALLDFDWACVNHTCHEFFSGLTDLGGNTHPANDKTKAAVLTGCFDPKPEDISEEESETWDRAKAWDAVLTEKGVTRPCDIAGIKKLEKLRELEDLIAPFMLTEAVMLKRMPQEQLEKSKLEGAQKILSILEDYGF